MLSLLEPRPEPLQYGPNYEDALLATLKKITYPCWEGLVAGWDL